jgi:hypothetical protein
MKLTDGQRKGIICIAFGLEPNSNAWKGMTDKKLAAYSQKQKKFILTKLGQQMFKQELRKMHRSGIAGEHEEIATLWFPFDNFAPKDAFTD